MKARIRLQRAQTPEQIRTLHVFQEAYKDAQEEEAYIRQRAQVLFDDVRKFEGRLLQVLMSFQLRCHNPYAKTAPASTEGQCRVVNSYGYETVEGLEKPKQSLSVDEQTMAEDVQVFAIADSAWVQQSTLGLRVPENAHVQICAPNKGSASAQHNNSVMPKSPHQGDDDFAGKVDSPVFHPSGQSVAQASEDSSDCATPCISGPISFGSVPRPASTIQMHPNPTSPKSDHGCNHEQFMEFTNAVLAHSASKGHYSPPLSNAFKQPYALSAPEAPEADSQNVQEDDKKLKALQKLERWEKQYWDAGRKLDTHHDTYDEQLEACYRQNAEPDRPCDVLEDEFAQEYLQRSNTISKEHTSAKQRVQVARRLAAEAGVDNPNAWDQESGFVSVPGEGPSPSWDAYLAQQFDGTRVRRWLNNGNATTILEPEEAQFALSGAEIETWESSSSRGDVITRKHVGMEVVISGDAKFAVMLGDVESFGDQEPRSGDECMCRQEHLGHQGADPATRSTEGLESSDEAVDCAKLDASKPCVAAVSNPESENPVRAIDERNTAPGNLQDSAFALPTSNSTQDLRLIIQPNVHPGTDTKPPGASDSENPAEKLNAAIDELERLENHYWAMQKELEDHEATFAIRSYEYLRAHRYRGINQCDQEFGPINVARGIAISRKLTQAEQDLQEARLKAKVAGVEDVNREDQESGFMSVAGEGFSTEDHKYIVDAFDGVPICDWMNDKNKTSKLETVEAQFALSGAEVDVWESSSTRGDAGKRKKIDANNDANKRRKLDAGASRSLPKYATGWDELGSDSLMSHT
jgi:hypothetical protein